MLPLFESKKKKAKLQEYFPCKVIVKDRVTGLVPVFANGSGDVTAAINSDGIAIHPAEASDMNASDTVEFYSWK